MIPTLLIFGLIFGRWWMPALIAAAFGWPISLLITGDVGFGWTLLGASALAVANTAAGAAAHLAALSVVRRVRRGRAMGG